MQKTVVVDKPLDVVFNYLSDFTTTTEWDPGTVVTVNHHGDGGVGTTYHNTSTFLGRKTQLTYVVREFIPRKRIRLRGENKTLIAVDTMTFRNIDAGTEVIYTAEFTFKGLGPSPRPTAQARLRAARRTSAGRHAQSAKPALTNPSGRTPANAEPSRLDDAHLLAGHAQNVRSGRCI